MRIAKNNLPVPKPTASFWLTSPHPLARHRSSSTVPSHCDIAIIGTGLAGVSAAYHVLSKQSSGTPTPSVVLFEARETCSGATGRNGGHSKAGVPGIKTLLEKFGPVLGNEVLACYAAQLRALKAVVEKEDIDCDLFVTRSYEVYFEQSHADAIKIWLDGQLRQGAAWTRDVQWLEGPYLERMTGVKNIRGATSTPAVSLWPYKLVTALLVRVLAMGARLYAETPVLSARADGTATILSTTRGATRGGKVIYATNGYCSALLPQYEGVIVPVRGQNSHLVPNPETHPKGLHLTNTYNLFYGAASADYLVPRPDGGIILGGGARVFRKGGEDRDPLWYDNVDDSTLIDEAVGDVFSKTMETHFRGWEKSEAKVSMMWSGIMGSTPDGLPHVGRIPGPQDQWIMAGFNGGGMSCILVVAEGIADMVLHSTELEETLVPSVYKTTAERISEKAF